MSNCAIQRKLYDPCISVANCEEVGSCEYLHKSTREETGSSEQLHNSIKRKLKVAQAAPCEKLIARKLIHVSICYD